MDGNTHHVFANKEYKRNRLFANFIKTKKP
jgi:hypothetical protein